MRLLDITMQPAVDMVSLNFPAADIVVGIPVYDEAATIGAEITAVQEGLRQAFPDNSAIIVVIGEASKLNTLTAARSATVNDVPVITFAKPSDFAGIEGKKWSERVFMKISQAVGAQAMVSLDGDLVLPPSWVGDLVRPVMADASDFVGPDYIRNYAADDQSLTDHFEFPFVAALYGKRVRQPVGGEFAVSARMIPVLLGDDSLWMSAAPFEQRISAAAIVNGFSVAEAWLGRKLHKPMNKGTIFGIFQSYAETLFDSAINDSEYIYSRIADDSIEAVSAGHDAPEAAGSLILNVPADEWAREASAELGAGKDSLSAHEWAAAVYDAFVSYRGADSLTRAIVIGTLQSFFKLRAATFVRENLASTYEEREALLDAQAAVFAQAKQAIKDGGISSDDSFIFVPVMKTFTLETLASKDGGRIDKEKIAEAIANADVLIIAGASAAKKTPLLYALLGGDEEMLKNNFTMRTTGYRLLSSIIGQSRAGRPLRAVPILTLRKSRKDEEKVSTVVVEDLRRYLPADMLRGVKTSVSGGVEKISVPFIPEGEGIMSWKDDAGNVYGIVTSLISEYSARDNM